VKATEAKYLYLLDALVANPAATQEELARALDVPASLVNRYLKRLVEWDVIRLRRPPAGSELTAKGEVLLWQASWKYLDFLGPWLERFHLRVVGELRSKAGGLERRAAVLYGATPLAGVLKAWATEAGLQVLGVCDEERTAACGEAVLRLDQLPAIRPGCIILSDWGRSGDGVLGRLLARYAPVIDVFALDGRSAPEWG